MVELGSVLRACIGDLRVVLEWGVTARGKAQSLDPVLASCQVGPYEKTDWLDGIAKNLDKKGPVRLTKENERRNYLSITTPSGVIDFLPLFGVLSQSGVYTAHNKGSEIDTIAGHEASLFSSEDFGVIEPQRETIPAELYAYALRVLVATSLDEYDFELHMIWGDKPVNAGQKTATIKHYGEPFIITRGDHGGNLVPAYTAPFTPEGVA